MSGSAPGHTPGPTPIETAGVELPPALLGRVDEIAAHVHHVWARARRAEGWRHGPERDDDARTHPGLVPYGELSEREKEYDRRTALAALRATVALGYRLVERED